jgi:hypothetical protein
MSTAQTTTHLPRTGRRLALAALVAAPLIVALALCWWITGRPRPPVATPGRPLLQNDDELFTEAQLQFQFTPPGNWSMQARSTEAPGFHKPERTVVKFKRLIPGLDVAWVKVTAIDAPADQSPAEFLKERKPPEPGWTVTTPAAELTVRGLPAARVVWGGPFDPDQKGVRDFSCEATAVLRGKQIFLFSGTYLTSDATALRRIRTAVDSAVFSAKDFAAAH